METSSITQTSSGPGGGGGGAGGGGTSAGGGGTSAGGGGTSAGGGAAYTAAPGSVHPPTSTCRPPASAQTSARLTAGDTIVMMATGAETSAITAPAAAAHDRTTWRIFVSSSLSDRESIPGAYAPA